LNSTTYESGIAASGTETQRTGRRTAGTFALIADARSDW